jgi:hypothetical protein
MKKQLLSIFCCLAGLSGSGLAQEYFEGPALSFTNLEIGYEQRYFAEDDLDTGNGIHAGFSIAPIPFLYFAGDFRYASAADFISGDDVDFLDARIGVGGRVNILDTVAVYVEGGAAYGKLGLDGDAGYDGTGFYIEPGVKFGILGKIEGSVALEYTSLESEKFLGAKAGLMIGLTDRVGITADVGVSEHSSFAGIGLRISW